FTDWLVVLVYPLTYELIAGSGYWEWLALEKVVVYCLRTPERMVNFLQEILVDPVLVAVTVDKPSDGRFHGVATAPYSPHTSQNAQPFRSERRLVMRVVAHDM